jgi:hypothetical protein
MGNYFSSNAVLTVNCYFYAMLQQAFIVVIFVAAIIYLGSVIYKIFRAKSGCASGCGKCGAVDFSKIEQQIREKNI